MHFIYYIQNTLYCKVFYKKYIIFSILKENILEKNLEKIAFEFNKFIIFEIFFNQNIMKKLFLTSSFSDVANIFQ